MGSPRLRTLVSVAAVVAVAAASVPAGPAVAGQPARHPAGTLGWSGGWATAVQQPWPGYEAPNWSLDGFTDQTLRQVVRISTAGTRARIRLTNRYGSQPLRLTGATIGRTGNGADVRPGTLRPLTFGGSRATTIAPGRDLASDPLTLAIRPLERLTVTLYFAGSTGPATFHEGALATVYRADGDLRFQPSGAAFTSGPSQSWYYLAGVDVSGGPVRGGGTVVTYGDSIIDGYGSTPDADNRYSDELAERLTRAGSPLAVVNTGLNGGLLLTDYPCFAGDSGLTRFRADVLDQPGVRTAIVHLGLNDIAVAGMPLPCAAPPKLTDAKPLINGHRALIRAAHARGVKVIGATLIPVKDVPYYYDAEKEAIRDALNHWIRTSGEYDAVVDFDRILADPGDADALAPAYKAADGMHVNDAGTKVMADAVNLKVLRNG
ncbi:SGNH/GDSL hydrolase family protein [Plantactinospora soyae]|uniref:Lysophospholipase L1-like esterase n=1 Tax=Plantactinospora soyae TaxID=1544732 RepID=A0A927QX92_9ACTN|nr:SGNH/GDSL hydrolase family protein [Plantactinospora soyae]MBE1486437.1 lysophospholipase L1-like esterase [Plantactinospora soyae]